MNTTINSVVANVTGAGQPLGIYQTGRDLDVSAGNVRTNNGAITLDVASPNNLTVTGNLTAGTATVTLNATGGNVTATGLISGGTLNVTANSTSSLNTAVGTLNANITGAGSTLTVSEADNLAIGTGSVRTNNGVISITTAANGSLTRSGNISAGTANVTLNLAGGTSGLGVVSGNTLNLTAGGASSVNTAISSLVANITSGALTVVDADGLTINAGGVRTSNAAISLTAGATSAGSLSGTGTINAGTGSATLTNSRGGVLLSSVANQVTAKTITIAANSTSAVNTSTTLLAANISGSGQNLTVNQVGLLSLGNITLANGTLTVNANGGMNGAAFVSAGTAGFVVLNASAGGLLLTSLSKQITASGLTVNAQNSTALNTSVDTLTAKITGTNQTLTVNEANGLAVGSGNIVANGAITLNLAAGSLNGTGAINAGSYDMVINAVAGGISPLGIVTATNLSVRAASNSTLTTNIVALTANVTGAGQSLTVNEANSLTIAAGNVVTNNGPLTLNIASGSLNGTGRINTGTGTITLNTPAGNVALASVANQITGGVLNVRALNTTVLNTSINSLNATITGTGSLTVNEANNITITQAQTANGAINLTTSANSVVNITSINAAAGIVGNLTVVNGNLFIDAPGIRATNVANLSQAQSVTIIGGSIIANQVILPAGSNTVNWLVTSSTDTGSGSLRDVITRVNAAEGKFNSTIVFAGLMTVNLLSQLPTMTTQMNVQGANNVTLNGTSAGASTSGFSITSTSLTPSTISLVRFQGFGAAGVDLIGARNITVSQIQVTGSGIGVRGRGTLTGSQIIRSTFTNNVLGASLAGATNLLIGAVGQGNTFTGGTGARGASTTGITISGVSNGTLIKGNSFNLYPTGISIVAATGLIIGGLPAGENNSVSNASVAGVYATGYCTGSSVIKTTFPTGVIVTKQYVIATSRFLTVVL